MVLVPWGRDQRGVAARAGALGVAAVVERGDGTEVALAAAIDRVLASADLRRPAGKTGPGFGRPTRRAQRPPFWKAW